MPTNAEVTEAAQRHLLSNYRQAPISLTRGRGAEVWDEDGTRYLDMYAGIAVSTLGHAHPGLVAAITEQAGKILHTTNLVYNAQAIRLAERLVQKSGLGRAFFCNSGTEAIEACVKLARRRAFLKGETRRTRFVAFKHAFHGRTLGALPLTGTPKYWEGFDCDVERVTHVDYGDLEQVHQAVAAHPQEICALVVEPVQGEGGVLPAPSGFLAGLRAVADEIGALLVVDEVQTGVGRTGTFFAFEQDAKIRPDAVALAKGLGGGVPIGAMLVRAEWNDVLTPGSHGTTFGGNPLACAAANAVLDAIEAEGLLDHVRAMSEHLSARLRELATRHPKVVTGERGLGLLRGLLMAEGVEARRLLVAAREQGVLLSVASERVLRLTPPLNVTREVLDEACERIGRAAATLS